MKTMKTFIAIIAVALGANVAIAGGNPRVDILPLNADRAVVAISGEADAQYEISIENERGEVVYYKETEGIQADYRKIFNFSKLEDGDYKLTASVNGISSTRNFTVNANEIAVGEMSYAAAPVFTFANDVLRVAYLNYPGEKVNLKIYSGNELVYDKTIDANFAVNEGLNLTKLESGNYHVVLASGNDVYDYTVRK
ncbi:MAG: hypothetical protein ACK5JD_12555 [Mangrovibacterium sp.]